MGLFLHIAVSLDTKRSAEVEMSKSADFKDDIKDSENYDT